MQADAFAEEAKRVREQTLIAGTTLIEQHFQQKIPDRLWHYTSLSSARNILASGSMWASECCCLNDKQEFLHWRKFAAAYVKSERHRLIKQMNNGKVAEYIEAILSSKALTSELLEVFILCFSQAEDTVSQWKDYSDNAKGVSLGFDLTRARVPLGADKAIRFAPCIYDDEMKRDLLNYALEGASLKVQRLFENAENADWIFRQMSAEAYIAKALKRSVKTKEEFFADIVRQEMNSIKLKLIIDLFSLATHFKHKGFISEQEWRLSLPAEKSDPVFLKQRKIRNKLKGPTPYIEIHFNGGLPIRTVMTGPCSIASTEEIERLKAEPGLGLMPQIESSSVPLDCTESRAAGITPC